MPGEVGREHFTISLVPQQRIVRTIKQLVKHTGGDGRPNDGGTIEKGRRGRVVSNITQDICDIRHLFVKKQPPAEVSEYHAKLPVSGGECKGLPGTGFALSRVFPADRFGGVQHQKKTVFKTCPGKRLRFAPTAQIETLSIREQLPHADGPERCAAGDLGLCA